ncbi:hypothetical protein Tco_0719640 [Tanacetum coccineum]
MFNDVKLQVDYECEMAFELLRLVKKQLKEGYVYLNESCLEGISMVKRLLGKLQLLGCFEMYHDVEQKVEDIWLGVYMWIKVLDGSFAREVIKQLGKIELEVCFGNEGGLSEECKSQLKLLLKNNMEIFAWEPTDMTGVPRRIIEYSLNVNASIELMCQKQRVLAPKKSQAVTREVSEWVKAGIVRPVWYPTWISNPVLVKKCDGSCRMCVDFKNLNSACPKDYYPL